MVASAAIMAAGSLAAAGLSAGAGAAASHKSYKYQSRLQREAAQLNYDYGIKSLENSPTATRKGLVSAGYNPMLAVQNATSGANAGWTSAGSAPNVDYGSAVTNALDAIRVKNETEQTDSTINLNNSTSVLNKANARRAISEAINNEIHSKYLDSREEKELGQISAQTGKLIRETDYYNQLADNMEAERRLQEMGLNVQKRGQDVAYNASKYAADVKAETERGTRTDRLPFGFSSTYYDKRGKEFNDWSDNKYWKGYGY